MKKVAKLVIIDDMGKYLLMLRSNHPRFGEDPDLPGGTVEAGESMVEAMLREVKEEVGVDIVRNEVEQIYSGADYSLHGTQYALFVARLDRRPEITMSWEHSGFEWLDLGEFLERAKNAKDTYMLMANDVLNTG
jgi:8-oxo-dGTP pyrophosphatase MutT (NUDIX family)